MWVTTQSCPKLSSLRLLTNTLRNFFLKDSLQNPRKTTNVPHTNLNLENGHGWRLNTTSLILQLSIIVSSRQFLQPTIIELFSIANDSICYNQLKYIIISKSLNYLIVTCRDMDHLKSGKYHIIIHPQLIQICQTWLPKAVVNSWWHCNPKFWTTYDCYGLSQHTLLEKCLILD